MNFEIITRWRFYIQKRKNAGFKMLEERSWAWAKKSISRMPPQNTAFQKE